MKQPTTFLTFLASLFLLSGCGSSDLRASTSPEDIPTSPSPSEPQTPEPPAFDETTDTGAVGVKYEAETQFFSGSLEVSDTYLSAFEEARDRLIFTVNSTTTDEQTLAIRYANTGSESQSLNLHINGLQAGSLDFIASADLNAPWTTLTTHVTLRAGINTIQLSTADGSADNVYVGGLYLSEGAELEARGATVPYHLIQAEDTEVNAEIIASDTTYGTLAAESSGRGAVRLSQTDDALEFVAPQSANRLTLRYAIPDSADGTGLSASLDLYVNGAKTELALNSRYSWVYGNYPYTNNPVDGSPHRFYDDTSVAVDIPAGASVRLQKGAGNTADYYVIDTLELETAPAPLSQPDDFIDVTEAPYLADSTGVIDSTQTLKQAINDARDQGLGLWLPPGNYTIHDRLHIDNIHIRGAGIWHTTLAGSGGKGGFFGNGNNITLTDIKIVSDTTVRRDADDHAALEGNFGQNSLIQNIWVEHMKVGAWFTQGTDGLLMVNGRVRNTFADGFNFHGGVVNSQISQFAVRNTGDDAFAMWSDQGSSIKNANNRFSFNLAQVPTLANTYAIYGGESNKLEDNIGEDTLLGSAGIAISQRFDPHPFSGVTEINRNTLNRTGGWDYGWNTSFGSVWVFTDGAPITAPIVFNDLEINDATYDAVLMSYNQAIETVTFNDLTVNGAGEFGIRVSLNSGELILNNVHIKDALAGGLDNSGITITQKGQNSGL